ncbi:MAG TPA: hypothetical protein VFE48_24205 [Methylomirabilota bacterium]|nr:hypothetical protein [Methylomirabilota bacterium]
MSEALEPRHTDDRPRPAFALRCACGTDIDVSDQDFQFGPLALVAHADYCLVTVRCQPCGTAHHLAIWTIDQQRFISELNAKFFRPEHPDVVALAERYHEAVQQRRGELEIGYLHLGRWRNIDLSSLVVDVPADRFFAPPMAVLAAARAVRQAVATRPGVPAVMRLGPYACRLSFDETPRARHPYALHLSVANAVLPGHLPARDRHWLVSLFFIPSEQDLLLMRPGPTAPVFQYRLPAYEPELNPC